MQRNKFIRRLEILLELLSYVNTEVDGEHINQEVFSDLHTCIEHCNTDVNYTPPPYYLQQLNGFHKQYNHYSKNASS